MQPKNTRGIDIDKIIEDSGVPIIHEAKMNGDLVVSENKNIVADTVCVNTGRVSDPYKLAITINLLIKYFDEKKFYMYDIIINSHEQRVDATLIFQRSQ